MPAQEGKKEVEVLQEKAAAAAAEVVELRHALQTASAKNKVLQLCMFRPLH